MCSVAFAWVDKNLVSLADCSQKHSTLKNVSHNGLFCEAILMLWYMKSSGWTGWSAKVKQMLLIPHSNP